MGRRCHVCKVAESQNNLNTTRKISFHRQTRLPDLTRHFRPPTSLFSSRRHSDFGLSTDTLEGTMEPPACVQNAMMKQDKKPFTYTPGGIDLSEVRSPRMQRRIERNANLAGVGETPRPPPQAQNAGPLPPSALAAMRPQTQVQVFPQPPPPPPMKNIPPPPPPPSCPLPTQKVTTTDNQVLERPDMTKIIPENPMALLRRTGGPAPRPSMVDAVESRGPPSPPQNASQPAYQPPTAQPSYQLPPPQRQFEGQSPIWQPQQQASPPVHQQFQAPSPPQRDFGGQSPRWPQNPTAQQVSPPVQAQQQRPLSQSFEPSRPSYQPPVIERQPTPRKVEQPTKVNSNVGSLYIPPINQSAQQPQRVVSPPTPPQREPQVQSPGTPPTLREAPKPWQGKGGQQQEVPAWARREDTIENNQLPSQITAQNANPQQRWQQQPNVQQPARSPQPTQQQYSPRSPPVAQPQSHQGQPGHPGGFPIHIEIRAVPYPGQPQEPEEKKPNAVYVTQPLILQHPGAGGVQVANPPTNKPVQSRNAQPAQPRSPQPAQSQPRQNVYQQQQVRQTTTTTRQENSNTRIIPIQIEQTPPSTPNERSLNRQLSWGQNPTQSNKFKVIQKITQTDDDEDDDTPITQHSARFTQEMPEQFKGMKVSNGDRFKQGVKRFDEENPRYRGGHIPSRIFKMLDESVPQQYQSSRGDILYNFSHGQQGIGQPEKYVHPSEQTVPEPKKYMGGNIPSRSFKILQAMTAPESCANVNNNEDYTYNHPPYPFPPFYPPPPYWHEYFSNYYLNEQSEPPTVNGNKSPSFTDRTMPFYTGRTTPQPSGRTTPSIKEKNIPVPVPPPHMYPFWPYPPINYHNTLSSTDSDVEIKTCSSTDSVPQQNIYPPNYPVYHPPYFDPYYYYYYYQGFPPVPPPYQLYPSDSENINSGYDSAEELANYDKERQRRNSVDNSVKNIKNNFEKRCQSATPRISVTPANQGRPHFLNKMGYNDKNEELEETEYEPKSVKEIRQQFEKNKSENKETQQFDVQKATQYSKNQLIEQTDALQEKYYERNSKEENLHLNNQISAQTEEETNYKTNSKEENLVHKPHELSKLKSIKSVNNITMEETLSLESDSSSDDESSAYENIDQPSSEENEDEIIPHQLSVIFEESERADSKCLRPCSAMTEASTINENSDEDSLLDMFTISNNLVVNLKQESSSCHTTSLKVGDNFIQSFKEESETCASFTLRSSSRSPRALSPCLVDKGFVETKTQTSKFLETNGEIVVNNKTYTQENYEIGKEGNQEEISKSSVKIEEIFDDIQKDVKCNEDTDITGVVFRKKKGRQAVEPPKQTSESESDQDFWQLIGKDKESPLHSNTNSIYYSYDNSAKTTKANSTIYDELKESDSPTPCNGNGRIMDMDSFVAKLEEIKRNSGLWDYENIDLSENSISVENSSKKYSDSNNITQNLNITNKKDNVEKLNSMEDTKIENKSIEQMINTEHSYIKTQRTLEEPSADKSIPAEEIESECSDESVDFWSQLKNDDDDDFELKRNSTCYTKLETYESETNLQKTGTKVDKERNSKTNSSASSRHSSFSKSNVFDGESQTNNILIDAQCQKQEEEETMVDEIIEDSSDSKSVSSEETQEQNIISTKESSDPPEPQTIKERINALKKNQLQKVESQEITENIQVSVKTHILALETNTNSTSKTTSTKSSIKSFEEYSDEEVDSGVISDLSRHISDNEEFPELKKLTRYERAATHSRLFKLLQDECDEEEDENQADNKTEVADKFAKLSVRNRGENRLTPSRSKLNLQLNKCDKEQNRNDPPVNEKLADELVQSILKRRKGQIFRNMPKERIYAAAIKILQEDADSTGTPSEDFSSLLSPLRGDTESSTPAQTPQEFYNEYKQYYESWNLEDDCDLIPSKSFKLLQEHISASKFGSIEGFLAKCPRTFSNKNINKFTKVSDCSSLSLDSTTTNEVTNTS